MCVSLHVSVLRGGGLGIGILQFGSDSWWWGCGSGRGGGTSGGGRLTMLRWVDPMRTTQGQHLPGYKRAAAKKASSNQGGQFAQILVRHKSSGIVQLR